jgi:hypothetical protein
MFTKQLFGGHMKSSVRVLGFALFAALFAASCDNSERLTEPAPMRQQFSDVVPGNDGKQYTLLDGQIKFKRATVSKWINKGGGQVVLEGDSVNGKPTMHVLVVPEGAVDRKTLFTMTIASPHHIRVDLRAQIEQKYRGETVLIDVGHLGFNKPILLGLDRSLVGALPADAQLTVLYDPDNGSPFQAMPTTIYAGYEQWVIGYLSHFSKYALAMN